MLLQTLPILSDLADSKASPATPPLPPTLAAESLFSHLRLDFPDFPKIHQKPDLSQNLPKSQT
jgi:hypothetical protein